MDDLAHLSQKTREHRALLNAVMRALAELRRLEALRAAGKAPQKLLN